MSYSFQNLQPASIYKYFYEICQIPHPSKKEERIIKYLMDFGKAHNLETINDATGNVIIRKPGTAGMENRKSVCLQSHMDMVCEKNADTEHDFDNDPIDAFVDGEWIRARGTTLGADDGIGVATQLALLAAHDIAHGPIECLFTVDEETGLTGAFGLDESILKSSILLNLDSEDEGEIFIGCAGGIDTLIAKDYLQDDVDSGMVGYTINVKGLKGGHSGDDINKGLSNAVKLMNRLLRKVTTVYGARIASFNGGNLRNAIAREAEAVVAVPAANVDAFEGYVDHFNIMVQQEYHVTEPDLEVSSQLCDVPAKVASVAEHNMILDALYACPHGVIAMSADIPNFVETSTNLASVKMEDGHLDITTSQRSSVESARDDVAQMVSSTFHLIGADVVHSDGYPGWSPNPDSEILNVASASYKKLFDAEPKVLAIHAGLECGLIGEKYPGMDMISYGPTIKGAHSPVEGLLIPTVNKFWDLTIDILHNIPVQE